VGISIAVSGKGGTGKTTLCGLIIAVLKAKGKTPILAIDADPNSNLNEALGVEATSAIGTMREEVLKSVEAIPAGIPKETYVEYQLQEALVEDKGFDLLIMGRPEGPGCYCYVNSLLRKYIDLLSGNYPYIVMDNEAGMEHLSRRTTSKADLLLIVSDPTLRGIQTAARIRDLAREEELGIGEIFLVVNRAKSELPSVLREEIEKRGLSLLAVIPEDPAIERFDLERGPLFDLPESSVALRAVRNMLEEVEKRVARKVA